MEDRVRFSLEKLLNIAHDDTGQGRRVANFLLAWWNAEAARRLRHRRPVRRRPRCLGGHGDDLHLSGARGGRGLSDRLSRRIESIIKCWRPETE